jgi:hypothetical protein
VQRKQSNIAPPTASRVAFRSLVLLSVGVRAYIEKSIEEPNAIEYYEYLLDWVESLGIQNEFEANEWKILHQPLGAIAENDLIAAVWRLEGVCILAWALGQYELPLYDELCDFNKILLPLGYLDIQVAKTLLTSASLKSQKLIEELCYRLHVFHWRMRNFYVNYNAIDFIKILNKIGREKLDIASMPIIEGDLMLCGERIDRVPNDIRESILSSAKERHQAAIWLLKGPELYSLADIST